MQRKKVPAGQGAVSPENTNRRPRRAGPSTSAGATTAPLSSGMLWPRWSSFHAGTGTFSARAFAESKRPARGRSSR